MPFNQAPASRSVSRGSYPATGPVVFRIGVAKSIGKRSYTRRGASRILMAETDPITLVCCGSGHPGLKAQPALSHCAATVMAEGRSSKPTSKCCERKIVDPAPPSAVPLRSRYPRGCVDGPDRGSAIPSCGLPSRPSVSARKRKRNTIDSPFWTNRDSESAHSTNSTRQHRMEVLRNRSINPD